MTEVTATDGAKRRGGSPFAPLRPAATLATLYAAAAVVWVAAGDGLPGGRWLAVHLFTLGVLSNLVVALTHHFAETVLHAPGDGRRHARTTLLNVGALGVLIGLPTGQRLLVGVGATAASAAVLWLYVALRRMRKRSLTGRFAFVVRGYERACGAFVHGAVLGGLLGVGVLSGQWHGAARLAHLHVNVLGWGGLTLLATVVFFGPTVLRTRMAEGADAVAARWIGHAATGLTVGTLALLATGAGGAAAVVAQILAALGLGVYALGVTRVCVPVLRVGRRARTSPHGRMLLAAAAWFVVSAWVTAVVAAAGTARLYDALGLALLVGVLGQAITASLAYLSPMVWPRGPEARGRLRDRLERLPAVRPALLNVGVAFVVVSAAAGALVSAGGEAGAVTGQAGAAAMRVGWAFVGAALAAQAALAASGLVRGRAGRSAQPDRSRPGG